MVVFCLVGFFGDCKSTVNSDLHRFVPFQEYTLIWTVMPRQSVKVFEFLIFDKLTCRSKMLFLCVALAVLMWCPSPAITKLAESWRLRCHAKKGKQKTPSQPTFAACEVNKGYEFRSSPCKVMAKETVYVVPEHARIQGEWKIKIKFVNNFWF